MNQDQMLSLLRTVMQIVGTIIVSHGTRGITGALWEQISGVVIIIGPTIWSMYAHTDSAKLASVAAMSGPDRQAAFAGIPDSAKIASVTAMPDVKQIVVKAGAVDGAATAAADKNQPKVVSELANPGQKNELQAR